MADSNQPIGELIELIPVTSNFWDQTPEEGAAALREILDNDVPKGCVPAASSLLPSWALEEILSRPGAVVLPPMTSTFPGLPDDDRQPLGFGYMEMTTVEEVTREVESEAPASTPAPTPAADTSDEATDPVDY